MPAQAAQRASTASMHTLRIQTQGATCGLVDAMRCPVCCTLCEITSRVHSSQRNLFDLQRCSRSGPWALSSRKCTPSMATRPCARAARSTMWSEGMSGCLAT
eukprot:3941106-Rhodomonas_salina.2